MSVWGALVGGFVGTLVLTTILRAASELRRTRIDLPFLLGTMVTTDRKRAKAIGYVMHFFFGFSFALVYLRDLRRDRALRMARGRAARRPARGVRGHGARQRPAPRGASADGRRVDRSEPGGTPRAARVHDDELRGRDPGRHARAHVAYGAIVGGFIAM